MTSDLPRLPNRESDAHKGNFGRVLLIGGSRGMSGAMAMAGMATLRSGAGLVKLAVPDVIVDTVATFEPSYMTVPLPCDANGRLTLSAWDDLEESLDEATHVALGPGMGRTDDVVRLATRIYCEFEKPMVVDADGLYAIAQRPDALRRPGGPRVLTPHAGEFARLVQAESISEFIEDNLGDEASRTRLAQQLAEKCGVVVLKGHGTVVTNGKQTAVNGTGNPGMATGGCGDVLTGTIAGLLGQGLEAWDAARLGVHVHGLAGDLAAKELGEISMIASDLIRYLPAAFSTLSS